MYQLIIAKVESVLSDAAFDRKSFCRKSNLVSSFLIKTLDGSTSPLLKTDIFASILFFLVNQDSKGFIRNKCCHRKPVAIAMKLVQCIPLLTIADTGLI